MFVKPANAGSSVGISKVTSIDELDAAVEKAAKEDGKIVVEEGIVGAEVECAVMGNEEPIASTVGEIGASAEFYDYDDKYKNGTSQLYIPARLPEEKIERLAREFRRTRKDFDRAVFSHRNPAGLGAVRKFHAGIKAMLEEKSLDLPLRIYAAAKALDFHLSPGEDETVKNIDEKFAENSLSFLRRASGLLAEEKGKLTENALRRSRFRNLICAFLRNDQPGESRWKRAYIQLKILLGMEYLQKLNPLAPRCGIFAITNLHKDCVYAPEAGKYLEEWFYSKVYSMHFCGRMVHNYPYSTGLRLLFCAFAAAEYLAGGFAIAEHLTGKRNGENPENPGRIPVNLSDMKRAVFLVDFSFSRSPAFRFAGTRKLIEECGRAENIGFLLK